MLLPSLSPLHTLSFSPRLSPDNHCVLYIRTIAAHVRRPHTDALYARLQTRHRKHRKRSGGDDHPSSVFCFLASFFLMSSYIFLPGSSGRDARSDTPVPSFHAVQPLCCAGAGPLCTLWLHRAWRCRKRSLVGKCGKHCPLERSLLAKHTWRAVAGRIGAHLLIMARYSLYMRMILATW